MGCYTRTETVQQLSREALSLLHAARGRPCEGPPDWSLVDPRRLLQLAARHQVDALCHWNRIFAAREGPRGERRSPPDELRNGLHAAFRYHSLRNEELALELSGLGEQLSLRGVDWTLYKGAWLAFVAYPDPGTRPVHDIDLGIRERDFAHTVDALRALGYHPMEPLPRTPEAALHRAHFGKQLRFNASGRRMVELHFRMVNIGPPLDEAWVWSERASFDVGATRIRVPGPEAMLLHLLLHANQHGFAVLRLLFDVRFALARLGPALRPERFVRLVRSLRCSTSAYFGLVLSRDLAGAEVPAELLEELRPNAARRAFFSHLWNVRSLKRLSAPRRNMEVEAPRLYLLELGRWRDKARYVNMLRREAGGSVSLARTALRALRQRGPEREAAPTTSSRPTSPDTSPLRPQRRRDVIVRRVEQDYAVYDSVHERLALLNPAAVHVLELCDGARREGDIAAEIHRAFHLPAQTARAQVRTALEEFRRNRLLEAPAGGGESRAPADAARGAAAPG